MPVSWVCRRAQNASGEGAGRNVNARHVGVGGPERVAPAPRARSGTTPPGRRRPGRRRRRRDSASGPGRRRAPPRPPTGAPARCAGRRRRPARPGSQAPGPRGRPGRRPPRAATLRSSARRDARRSPCRHCASRVATERDCEGREPADRRTPAPSAHVTGAAGRTRVVGGKTFGPAGCAAGCDHHDRCLVTPPCDPHAHRWRSPYHRACSDRPTRPAFAASHGPGSRNVSRGPAAAASTGAGRRIGRSPTCDPQTIAIRVRLLSTPR